MQPSLARLATIVCASLAYATTAPAAPPKAQKPPANLQKSSGSKHCLWRVTGTAAPFYLLGSIHSLRKIDYPLAPAIEQAIQQSQQFFFEYDPKKDDEFGRKMIRAAILPPGVQVKSKIRRETWNYLKKISRGGGYNWTELKAWAIAHYVLNYPLIERASGSYGLDNYVEGKARARRCPMFGLESIDDHVAVYAGMSDIESEAYLLEAIVYANQSDARFREMVAAWKAGDTNRLFALEMPELVDAPGLNPRFLEVRNARWIPVIADAIKSGKPTMIVAGAMHFSGPRSVLTMLRGRGYKIEQL